LSIDLTQWAKSPKNSVKANYSAILSKIHSSTDCFFGDFAHWVNSLSV